MIQLEGVFKTFVTPTKNIEALKNISLEIKEGNICGIIGYSGAGKSTLLRLLNGLEIADKGTVYIQEKEISTLGNSELNQLRKKIGMIFQQFNLLESQSVFQNIALPLILQKETKEVIKKRVTEILSFVGLQEKENELVSGLSGGQKQRVGIARALATNPSILLCDEATSALDPQTTESILELLVKINKELGVTIILITHEMDVIKKICQQVVIMENGEIVEKGSVWDIFIHPKQPITKYFVESIINSEIPSSIQKRLLPSDLIYKLTFLDNEVDKAILYHISQKYNFSFSILSATVQELGEKILGILTIKLEGDLKNTTIFENDCSNYSILAERIVIH